VLQGGVGRQDRVVRLHDGGRNLATKSQFYQVCMHISVMGVKSY
jgi:hypothetical protein